MIYLVQEKMKKAILAKEDKLAREDDLFKWSTKGPWKASPDLDSLHGWSKSQTEKSEIFFAPGSATVRYGKGHLEFESPIESSYAVNNVAHGEYFYSPRSKAAVIILGHWNSGRKTYNRLAKIYQLSGTSALRLTLPYHDHRRPQEMPIASGLLSADLNQTIQGMQQATVELRTAIQWLKERGHNRIGLIGASLGSSVALLGACHDPSVNAVVGYLTAADTADLVWESSATQHLRESFEPGMTVEDLRKAWSCISPSNYLSKLARPDFAMHVAWAKYDTVCPPYLTQKMISELKALKVPVTETTYGCGHNTLAVTPFLQLSGLKGLSFMREQLLR